MGYFLEHPPVIRYQLAWRRANMKENESRGVFRQLGSVRHVRRQFVLPGNWQGCTREFVLQGNSKSA